MKNSYVLTYWYVLYIYILFILSSPIHTKSTVVQASIIRISSRPMFVIVSCGCCFFQSCIAFAILLPVLYSRKCSVTFLKMQFCTATSTAMAIFTLGLLKLLPQVSTHYINSQIFVYIPYILARSRSRSEFHLVTCWTLGTVARIWRHIVFLYDEFVIFNWG